jgi:hypothetical protein
VTFCKWSSMFEELGLISPDMILFLVALQSLLYQVLVNVVFYSYDHITF